MTTNLDMYQKALDSSFEQLKQSLNNDLNSEEFDWDLLIEFLIIEDSPMTELFSTQTLQFAELYNTAKKLVSIVDDINSPDDEPEELEVIEVEAEEIPKDDFEDFKDIGE